MPRRRRLEPRSRPRRCEQVVLRGDVFGAAEQQRGHGRQNAIAVHSCAQTHSCGSRSSCPWCTGLRPVDSGSSPCLVGATFTGYGV